jgi:hypothetical protein
MSITTIARQAQGMRAGEVIAKFAEGVYFMRVDNKVTQVPPIRTHEPDNHEATSRGPANGRNCTRAELPQNPTVLGHQLEDPLRVVTVLAAPMVVAALLIMVMLVGEAAAAGAPHTGLAGEPAAEAIAEVEPHRQPHHQCLTQRLRRSPQN